MDWQLDLRIPLKYSHAFSFCSVLSRIPRWFHFLIMRYTQIMLSRECVSIIEAHKRLALNFFVENSFRNFINKNRSLVKRTLADVCHLWDHSLGFQLHMSANPKLFSGNCESACPTFLRAVLLHQYFICTQKRIKFGGFGYYCFRWELFELLFTSTRSC